jgi:hypothetical protein
MCAQVAETEGQALSSLVGGNEVIKELYQYLEDIGIRGAGLLEATSQSSTMGLIISEPLLSMTLCEFDTPGEVELQWCWG